MPDFVDLDQGVPDPLSAGPAQHTVGVGMRTILGAVQHGFGLLLLDTGVAERKGEFLTTAHGQDRVEQAGGGKNIPGGEAKIRLQGLVEGLRDDLRMTDRVEAVLVHPGVEGGRR